MSSKKVLIFSLSYFPLVGGAEIAVKEITDRLTDIQFDMVTLSFNPSEPKVERLGNVNVYRLNTSKKLFPLTAFMFARKLHRQNKYDAIWSIMAAYAGFAAMFFKYHFPKVKYILTLQEGDPIGYIKRKVRFVYPLFKKIFLWADVIQTISNYLADFARDMGYKGKVEIIPNGVNTKLFSKEFFDVDLLSTRNNLNKKSNDIFLITTSRLEKKNAVGDIINSLKFLSDNIKLIIVGVGQEQDKLEKIAKGIPFDIREKYQNHHCSLLEGNSSCNICEDYYWSYEARNRYDVSRDEETGLSTSHYIDKDDESGLQIFIENRTEKLKKEKELQSLTDNLGLHERVRFQGFIPHSELPKYLKISDIFIRPSLSEGMGNSFIEAMAVGLPVIATPVGGIVDFLKDGETGLFCEVNNPESIAKQVKRLMEDKNLRDKLVKNAKSMVEEKYDWNLITEQMKSKVFSII